jgi:alpha-glucosidase (family GH31 glycosyl hydrolase)
MMLLCGIALLAARVTADAPALSADSDTQIITAEAADFQLQTPTQETVSLLEVSQRLTALQASAPNKTDVEAAIKMVGDATALLQAVVPDREEMTAAIDATERSIVDICLTADQTLVDKLTATLDALTLSVAGFAETKNTVVRLAEDVAYLVAHAENVTKCATDGNVHAGDG